MTAIDTTPRPAGPVWNIGLWLAQIALAGLYGMAAWMHLAVPVDQLAAMGIAWASQAPVALVRFIGLMEMLGVVGLILPALTRVQPRLTVWAATGLLAIQALAIPFHMIRGELAVLPFNLVYVALAVLVVWGRTVKAPIPPRG